MKEEFTSDQSVRVWFDGQWNIGVFVRYDGEDLVIRVAAGEFSIPIELPFASYDVRKLTQVEVIASGYEWTCPNCEHFNSEIEVTETVTCSDCGEVFEVNEYHHAMG